MKMFIGKTVFFVANQMKENRHIVKETKKRSIFKAFTGRALEITVGTFVVSFFILQDLRVSFGLAVFNEGLCAITSYINDRIWNLFQYGREVIHDKREKDL